MYTHEPRLVTTGDPWLPHPIGRWKGRGEEILVHATTGPACAFTGTRDPLKGYGGTLVPSSKGGIRPLSVSEVGRAVGFSDEVCQELPARSIGKAAAREPGWQVVESVLALVELKSQILRAGKAGNCRDPEEDRAAEQMNIWLSAWARNPDKPRAHLELRPRSTPQVREAPTAFAAHRVGARKSSPGRTPGTGSHALSHRTLVTPAARLEQRSALRSEEAAPAPKAGPGLQALDLTAAEAVMSKLADSTRQSYNTGWKQWSLFMSGTGVSPFLQGESRAARLEDKQWLLRFVTFLHEVMKRTSQGIRQRLSAVRYAHIAAGYPDPLVGRVRLWAALQGFTRWETPRVRKVPVTPEMLRWIKSYLAQGSRTRQEQAALWAAVCTGWFFMLRASEYLPPLVSTMPLREC